MNTDKSPQDTDLQYGDVVKVRDGFRDPNLDVDMSGWHGRVRKVYPDEGTALIAFDSLTLLDLPEQFIEQYAEEGYSWSDYGYDLNVLIKVERRDTRSDVQEVRRELNNRYLYSYLGEEGREMNQIFWAIDPDGIMEPLNVWEAHLRQILTFPFTAVVDEFQEHGPLRGGDEMRVLGIELLDERYGLIVEVERDHKRFLFPLCDLAAVDEESANHDLIHLYRVWFANN